MPIYEYYCPNCNKQAEIILRMADVGEQQMCDCGGDMIKLISLPQPPIMVVTNKDMLVNTLNDDDKSYKLPDKSGRNSARYKAVIANSLTREKQVRGRGF